VSKVAHSVDLTLNVILHVVDIWHNTSVFDPCFGLPKTGLGFDMMMMIMTR
jgi:hypothetical protein